MHSVPVDVQAIFDFNKFWRNVWRRPLESDALFTVDVSWAVSVITDDVLFGFVLGNTSSKMLENRLQREELDPPSLALPKTYTPPYVR